MNEQARLRGGQILARCLKELEIEHVFTLSGGFCNPALEGMRDNQIKVVNTPHEQIAGHLADAHARVTRKPAVCFVGPEGFANAVPAMLEALGDHAPIMFITSSSTLGRKGAGGFKEIDDVAIAAPLTKYSAMVPDGRRIPEFIYRAYDIATSGTPGSVHLSIPVDLMFSSFPADIGMDARPRHRGRGLAGPVTTAASALEGVLSEIASARKPIIITGVGVWWDHAEKTLASIAHKLGIPVFNAPLHRKVLPQTSPAYMGLADVHQFPPSGAALAEADLVLMLGCRLDNQFAFGDKPFFKDHNKVVCVNSGIDELEVNFAADIRVQSDVGAFLDALGGIGKDWSGWLDENLARRDAWARDWKAKMEADPTLHPLKVGLAAQASMEDGDWLAYDGGNTHFWAEIAINIAAQEGRELGGILHPGAYSLLGCGVSLAVSAKRLNPDAHVVLLSGDGAFLSGGLSIETAFQENLPITVVVDNNGGLACIREQQERLFADGGSFATSFRDIPFHRMIEGLGGYGEEITSAEDLPAALKRARESGKVACLNVKTQSAISPIIAATADKREKASIE